MLTVFAVPPPLHENKAVLNVPPQKRQIASAKDKLSALNFRHRRPPLSRGRKKQ